MWATSYLGQALLETVLAAHGKVLNRGGAEQRVVVEQPVGAVDGGACREGVVSARGHCHISARYSSLRLLIEKLNWVRVTSRLTSAAALTTICTGAVSGGWMEPKQDIRHT